jgi:hypothetical protein
MAVDPKALTAALKKDNPSYERVVKSDLRDVVDLAKKPGVTAKLLSTEMRLVKPEKWAKYKNTRAYLISQVPGLDDALAAKLVKFRTQSITKAANGGISHIVAWSSDSGDLADLKDVKVREHVWWDAPGAVTKELVDATYKGAGQHNGMGGASSPGTAGSGKDDHTGLGPFTQKMFDANLLPLKTLAELKLDQAYQMSVKGGPWQEIPGSRFVLRRRVALIKAGVIRIEMTKAGVGNPTKLSNVHDIKF